MQPTTTEGDTVSTVATMMANYDADVARGTVENFSHVAAVAPAAYKRMQEAAATIERCAAAMRTCEPRARFAYASQITKAKNKMRRAEHEIKGW